MTRVVLSIGSNMGERLAHLQAVVTGFGAAVRAVSPVFETAAWGGVSQQPFLNAVLIAEDAAVDCHGWLRRGQELENAAGRVREQHWGPRTLDVDLISCQHTAPGGGTEVIVGDEQLTLPHPYAHQRAFVLMPWLAVEPDAVLTVAGARRPVVRLLEELDPAERAGVRRTGLPLRRDPLRRNTGGTGGTGV